MLIRECAPLCLAQDSGWGGVSRGWAWIAAAHTMLRRAAGVKRSTRRHSERSEESARLAIPPWSPDGRRSEDAFRHRGGASDQ
jgi:hypothetical protein